MPCQCTKCSDDYQKNPCCRELFSNLNTCKYDNCCPNKKPKVRGRFQVAYILETPKVRCASPCSWQLEFMDTPSKVENNCRKILKWVNRPPVGECEPCATALSISPKDSEGCMCKQQVMCCCHEKPKTCFKCPKPQNNTCSCCNGNREVKQEPKCCCENNKKENICCMCSKPVNSSNKKCCSTEQRNTTECSCMKYDDFQKCCCFKEAKPPKKQCCKCEDAEIKTETCCYCPGCCALYARKNGKTRPNRNHKYKSPSRRNDKYEFRNEKYDDRPQYSQRYYKEKTRSLSNENTAREYIGNRSREKEVNTLRYDYDDEMPVKESRKASRSAPPNSPQRLSSEKTMNDNSSNTLTNQGNNTVLTGSNEDIQQND